VSDPARVAYLAPEIPSVSATFVYREAAAVEEEGVPVETYSVHAVDPASVSAEARPLSARTEALYARKGRLLSGALRTALRHPLRSARTLATALGDTLRGRFARPGQRARVLAQALAGLALAGRLERRGVRHLHIHFAHAPATLGMYAALAAGIPFSVTAHANDLYAEASLLREKVDRAHAFVTISEANRRFLAVELGERAARRVGLVRCGIDLRAFAPRAAEPAGPPVIFALGRLVPKKGFDVLIRALAEVAPGRPDLTLEIAGDGPERAALEALARDLGVGAAVRFLGVVGRDAVLASLRRATVFALPCRLDGSDRDGIPVALMEAMAVGVPVVSTRISGVPELVESGGSGLLVPAGDAPALARALSRLLGNPALRARLAAGGRARVVAEFEQGANARRLLAAIRAPARPSAEDAGISL